MVLTFHVDLEDQAHLVPRVHLALVQAGVPLQHGVDLEDPGVPSLPALDIVCACAVRAVVGGIGNAHALIGGEGEGSAREDDGVPTLSDPGNLQINVGWFESLFLVQVREPDKPESRNVAAAEKTKLVLLIGLVSPTGSKLSGIAENCVKFI